MTTINLLDFKGLTRKEKRDTILTYIAIIAILISLSLYSITFAVGERSETTGTITSLFSEADEDSARFYLIVKLDTENKAVQLRTSRKPYYKIGAKVRVKVKHSTVFSHKRYAFAGMVE